ncbi:hypothetical protein DBR32_06210 [Taibaiella sp. KBW10]|uniref:Ig-like domain-containing protein n=1 Tax=Taibaiella sp. KBW10 TaxID=2153357 RepID=UPI000F5B407D|nr:T9SS type A sorting domain-containing protein [Taibaiella sp. KBW10]RQO31548.1 hypothetical protein DBR32_06210 [Taibaiella sp. KBW10]
MNANFTQKVLVFLFLLFGIGRSSAQSVTISTAASFINNNGTGTVTFNFQNTNPYPVIITDVAGVTGSSGLLNASIWYKPTPITAAPGLISVANGWTQAASGTFTGIANSSTSILQPILSNISFTIPANTTYGIAVFADGQRYFTMSAAQNFSGGGCNFLMGPSSSYGGGAPNTTTAPTNNPRGWIGSLTFKPAIFANNNAALAQLTSPLNFCQGLKQIKVKVQNSGHNVINTVAVNWLLNGVAQTPFTVTTPLDTLGGTGINEIEVLLGTYTFTNASVPFKAWTTLPNGVPDTANGNDTITRVLKASLAGTYTINNASPTAGTNYNNFTDFTNDLSNYGMCGPIVANVVAGSGPYNEIVSLGNISGSSAANTLRINGNGATVQFANNINQRQLLTLTGTKYTRIDSLKFVALAADYGWGALITNGAVYDSITRCVFDLSAVTTTSSTNAAGITFTASNSSPTTVGTCGSNCFIANNQIKGTTGAGGAYYCVTLYGDNNNNIIRGNKIENFYFYGMYIYEGANNIIENNDINRATKTNTSTFYGIYSSCATPNALTIRNNRIHSPYLGTAANTNSFYGIYNFFDGTATAPVKIYNNAIYNITQGGVVYGIYGSATLYNLYYHNTIDISKPLTGTSSMYGIYLTGANTGTEVKNNLVSITSGTLGSKYGFYYSALNSVVAAAKNNFYLNSTQAGTQYYGFYTTNYTTQAAFQTAYPTFEVGSPAANPQYLPPATSDFIPNSASLIAAGTNVLTTVGTDILGMPRTPVPTIGAFEVTPSGNDNIGPTMVTIPTGNYCSGIQPVAVTINNFGVNNVNTFQINWRINGVLQTPVTYIGTILVPATAPSGSSFATIGMGTVNLNAGANSLVIWTSQPNGTTDGHPSNDTLYTTLTPSVFTASAVLDTICSNGMTQVNLSPATGYATGALEWQYSTNGTTWTPIPGSDAPNYDVTGIGTATQYRARIITGGSNCYSTSKNIHVAYVTQPTVTAAERCGPGALTLNAGVAGGLNLKWYTNTTNPVAVGNGTSFTTPSLSATTTYYVSAAAGSGNQATGKATPLSTSGNTGFSDVGLMFNAISPFVLSSVDVYPTGTAGTGSVTIALKNAAGTTLQTATAPVTVTSAGTLNTIPLNFTVPVGTGHRLVVMAATGVSSLIRELTTGFTYPYTLPGVSSITSAYSGGATASYYYYLYNWQVVVGCESPRVPVTATIRDLPSVALGNDLDTCITIGSTITLDPGTQPSGSTFLWDDNTTGATRSIGQTGTYAVKVTNQYSCFAHDTINIITRNRPTVNLEANGTNFCIGGSKVLDAGPGGENGGDYYWTTGATTRTITVVDPGTYIVYVTSNQGCLTVDTVEIVESGYSPTTNGILALATGPMGFNFNAVNAQNVVNYEWNFGDNTPVSNAISPNHTYAAGGVYTIKLKTFSICDDKLDSSTVYIVGTGLKELTQNEKLLHIYPNPNNGKVLFIEALAGVKTGDIVLYNTLGQSVYKASTTLSGTTYKLELPDYLASGIYNLYIQTNKGPVSRKLEIIK